MTKQWWARAVLGRTSVSDPLQEPERSDARFEVEWRPLVKKRLLVVLGILAVWAVGLEAQLVYLQVVSHEAFVTKAQNQQTEIATPEAPRGDVVDRNGQKLAYSVESFDVYANPSKVKDPVLEAQDLCRAFADCSADEFAKITATLRKAKVKNILIRSAREMSPDAVTRVRELTAARAKAAKNAKNAKDDTGAVASSVRLERESVRYYPKLDLAAHVIGFVKADGKGGGGVEFRYDTTISGVSGRVFTQRDGRTDEMFTRIERAPKAGTSVELTIDVRLQHIAERELQAGILAVGATGGSVIILDPNTGEILAQASYPNFNPNTYRDFSEDDRRNRGVQDINEPGSTFKIVTASAALNEGILTPSQLIDTNPGYITFPGRVPIHEDKQHNYGVLSFVDVIVKSSNVGAVKAGLLVGSERMLQYVRRFGFGARIAPDYPGESPGRLEKGADVSDSALASISMGYQIGATPIQIAAAASVIANGGLLIEPHLVRALIRDGRRQEIEPKVLRRVITPETAMTMTTIMEDVVARGTGRPAALDRYRVAGKTGTTSKVVDGKYSTAEYNVSFVGFVPSRKPVFTILVVVDTPRIGPAYGGAVAAPIFKRISEAALQYAGVPPSINAAPPIIVAADRHVLPLQPAVAPAVAPAVVKAGGRVVMPDLRGMTLRDALRVATALGLSMTTDGDGVVVTQTPLPGAAIDPSGRGTLQLRRAPLKSNGSDR